MSDGRIIIDTKIDETGLDKGLDNVDKRLKTNTKAAKDSSASLKSLAGGLTVAAVAFKKGLDVANQMTDALRGQIVAEKQLEQAARNNPFLQKSNVESLKSFASQLQSITMYGDEELIGFMGQLAAAGRTQSEIQKIISASVDIAASGTMSLESAMRNLNKTFGGLSGELGETIPEIKSLTEEQLKSGAAVDLMASRYKGMAEEITKAAGGGQQLKNLQGDFKEALGLLTAPTTKLWEQFWTTVYTKGIDTIKKLNKDLEMFGINMGLNQRFAANIEILADPESLQYQSDELIDTMLEQLDAKKELTKLEFKALTNLVNERNIRRENAAQAATQAREAARLGAIEDKRKERLDFIKKVNDERDKAIEKIKLQAKVQGDEVDQLDIINAYAASYVQLISESGGLVRETDREAQALLKTTLDMSSELERQNELREKAKQLTEEEARALEEQKRKLEALRKEMQAALDAIQPDRTVAEQLQDQLDALDDLFAATEENEELRLELEEEYAEKRKLLAKQVADAKVAQQREEAIRLLEIANQFASQYNEIMRSIQALAVQYIENDTKAKVAAVEDQYQAGEISAQEYEDRLTEINRKAAQERYKADMWAWSGNIASAVANTALGATKALAEGGAISGPILAAMIVAAGGAQLASIIAAKPIPPSFATGGIVGGTSYTGDKVVAMLNSKEMNLNAGQQRNLFDRINNDDLGGGSRVQVFNQASNDVRAEPQITEDGVRLMIRKTVAKDMADGRFNSSYRAMQNGLRGTRLTN